MTEQWKQTIASDIASAPIMAYIRGTKEQQRCGFSRRVVDALNQLNVAYQTRDMDSDPELWQTLKELNNWPTAPQIYIKGEFVGGCDIFLEMVRTGEAQKMLEA